MTYYRSSTYRISQGFQKVLIYYFTIFLWITMKFQSSANFKANKSKRHYSHESAVHRKAPHNSRIWRQSPWSRVENRGRLRSLISGRRRLVSGNWSGGRATGWRGELEDDRSMGRGGLWPTGRASRQDDGGCSGGDGDTTAVVTGKWAREGRREALDT